MACGDPPFGTWWDPRQNWGVTTTLNPFPTPATPRLSDEDVERIAKRVAEIIKAP